MTSLDSAGADNELLARFGYRQELRRSLGSFSSFAAGFSYISILSGLFQTFYLGFDAGGPAFVWTWPLVLGGQLLVALCFAEMAAQYPLAGGVYQWATQAGSTAVGVVTGWVYLACLIFTLAAVPLALQATLPQMSQLFVLSPSTGTNAVLLGCLLLVASTAINALGVRLLAWINNVGVVAEIVGLVALIGWLGAHARRAPHEVLFDVGARGASDLGGYMGPFLMAAGLTASYTLYGYDTAGTLAEETHEPHRRAPRAILQALLAAGAGGLLLLMAALCAAPDLRAPVLGQHAGGLPYIVREVLGDELGRLLLTLVTFAITVCTLAVHAGIVRVVYAMARDGRLPGAARFSRVSTRTGLPLGPTLASGAVAGAILLANVNAARVVELITSVSILWANLAYLIVGMALLRRRWQGAWPPSAGGQRFSLGRFGLPLNVAATLWSAAVVLNVGWPRAEVYGPAWYQRYSAVLLTVPLLAAAAWYGRRAARQVASGSAA